MARPAVAFPSIAALFLSACGGGQDVELVFQSYFGERALDCTTRADGVAMTDLRFFVHDAELLLDDGTSAAVALREDGVWQSQALTLVDLEDGSGSCRNGSAEMNQAVRGTVRSKGAGVRGVRFRVGVPERLNHADPMRAAPPLNLTIMHWHWRSGYKFMRAGVEGDNDEAWLHLGSAGCKGTIGRLEGCSTGNRVLVELTDFDPSEQHIAIDLQALFAPSDLADGVGWSCQSGVTEDHCESVFAALGIDGQAAGVFRAAHSR